MKSVFLCLVAVVLLAGGCKQTSHQLQPLRGNLSIPSGPYFGFSGDSVPRVLMPGFVSTSNIEQNGTFSPDGKEFVYCVNFPGLGPTMVATFLQEDGRWSEPEILPFSGPYGGVDPLYAPDGKRLYFTSFRPLPTGGPLPKDADIWFVEKINGQWGAPQNLGMPVNSDNNQFYNSVAKNGNIYFNARDTASNTFKIYVAVKTGAGYQVEELQGLVNTGSVHDPFVSPDEDFLLFASRGPDALGGADLYISYRSEAGWGKPIHLDAPINSPFDEKMPSLSSDNKLLIFTSGRLEQSWDKLPRTKLAAINSKIGSIDNGLENIYWVNAAFIEKLRPKATEGSVQQK